MLDDNQILSLLEKFAGHVDNLATLAVELRPDSKDLQKLRRQVNAALKTNDLEALRLAGEQLQPYSARILESDDALLQTLHDNTQGAHNEDQLLPLIDQFRIEWPSFKRKRKNRIFDDIKGILYCYMIYYEGVKPEQIDVEL